MLYNRSCCTLRRKVVITDRYVFPAKDDQATDMACSPISQSDLIGGEFFRKKILYIVTVQPVQHGRRFCSAARTRRPPQEAWVSVGHR